jgi:hypothetical protein
MNAKEHAKLAREMSLGLVNEVNAVLIATAIAETEREACDKIHRRLLAESEYNGTRSSRAIPGGAPFRVTEPKDDWLMDEESSARYYAALDAAYAAAGYELEPGYCPALIAGHALIKAENAMIVAAGKWFPAFVDEGCPRVWGENRDNLVKLLIGLVVNFPGYKAPKLKG